MESRTKDISQNLQEGRRGFLKTSALISGGMFFMPASFWQSAFMAPAGPLGARLAPIAMADDVFGLVMGSMQMPADFRKALTTNLNEHLPGNTARLARNFPDAGGNAVALLKIGRESMESKDELGEEKLGLALGAIAYNAVNNSLAACKSKQQGSKPDAGVYLDAAVLKAMNGMEPGQQLGGDSTALSSLFKEMVPRVLTRFHTLIPDDDDAQNWVLRVYSWRNEMDSYFDELAKAYMQPDQKKINGINSKSGFINTADALYREARSMHKDSNQNAVAIKTALEKAKGQSLYTKTLASGYSAIEAAAAFYEQEIDEQELVRRLKSS
ncbi:hypothetical protein D770_10025 [Flammeovirgaceae bacterium 311]|nr:hypothetical protein D770_10025 [Flammeovirgaceae bacterium 311]